MPYYKRDNTGQWYGAEQPLCGVYCSGAVNEEHSTLCHLLPLVATCCSVVVVRTTLLFPLCSDHHHVTSLPERVGLWVAQACDTALPSIREGTGFMPLLLTPI